MEALIEALERSVAKHGPDKVLTLGHLLNLLKKHAEIHERDLDRADYYDAGGMDDDWGDRS